MILAGRRINDNMGLFVASEVIRLMLKRAMNIATARILIMGITFKENCPDVRNTRVVDVVKELRDFGATVDIYDPWVEAEVVRDEYGLDVHTECPAPGQYECIVLAVAHRQFIDMSRDEMRALGKPGHVVYDIKSVLPSDQVDQRL
jgi:UDP-N-acetyl-D-galactosamine dehydrogenase